MLLRSGKKIYRDKGVRRGARSSVCAHTRVLVRVVLAGLLMRKHFCKDWWMERSWLCSYVGKRAPDIGIRKYRCQAGVGPARSGNSKIMMGAEGWRTEQGGGGRGLCSPTLQPVLPHTPPPAL